MAPPRNKSGMSNDPVHDVPGRGGGAPAKGGKSGPGDINITVPTVTSGSKSKEQQFAAWATKQGVAGATVTDIWYWSHHTPNVDPYLWTSVLLKESGAKHLTGNGQLVSSGQAVGIGQIALSWVGQPIPWSKNGEKFTADGNSQTGIGNYGVNLRMSAYLWGEAVSKVGWQKAYTDPTYGYNPNDPNKDKAWAAITKTYTSRPAGNPSVGSPSQGPADTSPAGQTGTSTTPAPFKNPYVTGVTKGPAGKLSTTDDPNKALQYDGQPLQRSDFLTLRDQLTSYYVSYTGKRPTNAQIQQYIVKGWNPYTLETLLSKSPDFTKSPIWKQYVTNWQNDPTIKDVLPAGGKIDPNLARQAIVNQWTSDTIATKLRQAAGYINSNEFKGNIATMLNAHEAIMGTPDPQAMVSIKDAALQGWTTDQYAAWLRSQPAYTSSPEYQSKALTMLQGLGLITGAQTILTPGSGSPGPGSVQPATQTLTPDKRVKGNPDVLNAPLPGLEATLSSA